MWRTRRLGGWRDALAAGLLLVGLAVSTRGAQTALFMGERPVTLLPGAGLLLEVGIPALVVARLLVVLVPWLVAARVAPRYRTRILALGGLCWLCWGVWQHWVLLALT